MANSYVDVAFRIIVSVLGFQARSQHQIHGTNRAGTRPIKSVMPDIQHWFKAMGVNA
jgi:hypothetical protein